MSLSTNKFARLPPDTRNLLREFRDQLSTILARNLVGAYMHGSIAFSDYEPQTGDIDFFIIIRKPLNTREFHALDRMHRTLATRFERGRKLDGYYIPLTKARRSANPKGLVYGAHGRLHQGGFDDAWALHLEHLHGSAYIRLYGPRASRIFPMADLRSIRKALYRELVYSRKIIDTDPWWAVLNLCRLVCTFRTGRVVISKLAGAEWALKQLSREWHPLIRSAIKAYKQTASKRDRAIFKKDARRFLGYASIRVIAFDSVWDNRPPPIAHLRKRTGRDGR